MTMYFKFLPAEVLNRKIKRGDFPFSHLLFWDTSIEKIDPEKNKNFIIERVLGRGLLRDFYFLLQLYTTEEITVAVKKSKVLDAKTVNFCSIYFKIPITDLHASPFYS
jgi:hypothetical protein